MSSAVAMAGVTAAVSTSVCSFLEKRQLGPSFKKHQVDCGMPFPLWRGVSQSPSLETRDRPRPPRLAPRLASL